MTAENVEELVYGQRSGDEILIMSKTTNWQVQKLFIFCVIVMMCLGCREKFYADLPSPATGFLIVEGIINVGDQASTVINLSRTSELDSREIRFENNARVFIEDDQGNQYELQHSDSGRFSTPPLNLPVNQQYRIHVNSAGKEYYSAFTETKISPQIDSVFWAPKNDGIEIQLTTHDDQANSRYYYWNFTETWEYNVPYYAIVKYDPVSKDIVTRGPSDPQIYSCWMTLPSTTIVVGSTAKLSQDLLFAKPIAFVSATTTNKLVKKYSIIVRQSVLTKEAYEYLERMRRNTEQTGSVFDAQPSQLRGNITCASDSSEMVVGFITASSITEKRIFVARADLPPLKIKTFYEPCFIENVANNRDSIVERFEQGIYMPIDTLTTNGVTYAITSSAAGCVDCRMLGGVNTKPSFWP